MLNQKKYKICVFAQSYNELETKHLPKWIKNVKLFADAIAVYDDGSQDGTFEYLVPFCDVLLRKKSNDWKNELLHKKALIKKVQERIKPDFVFWLDIDELVSRQIVENIQNICHSMRKNKYDGAFFQEVNLWKSKHKFRVDSSFFDSDLKSYVGWFCRLWDCGNSKKLHFETPKGLHHQQHPVNINFTVKIPYVVFHYGFSSEELIQRKYIRYKKMGQKGPDLERISPDSKAVLRRVNPEWFVKEKEEGMVK